MIAILAFLRTGPARYGLAAIAFLALLAGAYLKGRGDGHAAGRAATEHAVLLAQARNDAALATAETQRRADVAAAGALEKDLTDAYRSTPDSRPSAARLALACRRLRNASPGAKLPAACGPAG